LLGKSFAHLREERRVVPISPLREADFHLRFLWLLLRFPALRSSAEMASEADA
jgi:hypothetical protein